MPVGTRNLRMTAIVRLGHACIAAMLGHLLATSSFRRSHCDSRLHTCHYGQRKQQDRQQRDRYVGQTPHTHESNYDSNQKQPPQITADYGSVGPRSIFAIYRDALSRSRKRIW